MVSSSLWNVEDAKIFRYSAIAEEDERNRSKGEALFPEHKSLSFLLERKKAMTQASWESEYQQNPIVAGGGIFPIEKLRTLDMLDRAKIKRSVRYWDKAGTADGGAYTVGVLMHMMMDDTFVIEHVARGQWSALKREEQISYWARERPQAFVPARTRSASSRSRAAAARRVRRRPFACWLDTACLLIVLVPTAAKRCAPIRWQRRFRAATYFCTPAPGSVTCWPRWRLGRTASTRTRSTLARARSIVSAPGRVIICLPEGYTSDYRVVVAVTSLP